MHTEAHLFSVPNDCLWYDKLWGPSQRVVTLFGCQDVIAAGCGGAPPPCVVHFHRKVTGGGWELGGVLSGAAEEAGSWKSAGSWHESEKTFEEVE